MRILVTGSRTFKDYGLMSDVLISTVLARPERHTLVHGGCAGADGVAHTVWLRMIAQGYDLTTPEVHSADWATHGKAAGPRRNAAMIATGIDLCLAFPIGESRGTRGCIKMAHAAGVTVQVFSAG